MTNKKHFLRFLFHFFVCFLNRHEKTQMIHTKTCFLSYAFSIGSVLWVCKITRQKLSRNFAKCEILKWIDQFAQVLRFLNLCICSDTSECTHCTSLYLWAKCEQKTFHQIRMSWPRKAEMIEIFGSMVVTKKYLRWRPNFDSEMVVPADNQFKRFLTDTFGCVWKLFIVVKITAR